MISMRIGEVAGRVGIGIETIRYYEREGLLAAPRRRPSGYREYDESAIARLQFIRRTKELGFSLDEIRALLRLVDERDQPCAEARAVAAAHLEDVQAKVADLKRMERVLKDVVAQCSDGTLLECPLLETLFRRTAEH